MPPSPLRITLVGLPGCGKSTVGRHLGRRLELPFVDSDHTFEERMGCSILEFFEYSGEERFRDAEEKIIDELTQGPDGILATGGGAVLRPANRQHLKERTQVIYLHASASDIAIRLRHDRHRPLLQVADPAARLVELYNTRDPLYRETAHHIIEIGRPSVGILVGAILHKLELAGVIASEAGRRR